MEERERGDHFTKRRWRPWQKLCCVQKKSPPVADADPGFTQALEGLCAFRRRARGGRRMAQFTGSGRVPPAACGAGGEGLPHFGPVSEMQRAGFSLKSKLAPPLASPLPRDQSESLSSTHCTPGPQNPAGSLCLEESRWNTPISSQRRHGAIWPRSSKVKAKLRSGVQVLGKCTVEERGMLEP